MPASLRMQLFEHRHLGGWHAARCDVREHLAHISHLLAQGLASTRAQRVARAPAALPAAQPSDHVGGAICDGVDGVGGEG